MATGREYIDWLQDCLRRIDGLSFRKMFGEYAMYANEVVVGLVCDQCVYIKETQGTAALLRGRAGMGPPFPGAKPWFMLTEDELLEDELVSQVISAALRDLPVKSSPKPKRTRTTPAPKGAAPRRGKARRPR